MILFGIRWLVSVVGGISSSGGSRILMKGFEKLKCNDLNLEQNLDQSLVLYIYLKG